MLSYTLQVLSCLKDSASVTQLTLASCSIAELPDLAQLVELQELRVRDCSDLPSLPGLQCLARLSSLELGGCGELKQVQLPSCLKELLVGANKVVQHFKRQSSATRPVVLSAQQGQLWRSGDGAGADAEGAVAELRSAGFMVEEQGKLEEGEAEPSREGPSMQAGRGPSMQLPARGGAHSAPGGAKRKPAPAANERAGSRRRQ